MTDRDQVNSAMDRYADGDDAAFGELYDLLAPRLFAFSCRQIRNRAAAEDVVQQTLLQMHCARASYMRGAEVVPWAFTIARRLMIDSFRRSRREEAPLEADDDPGPGSEETPADVLQGKQTAARLGLVLEALPDGQRMAFELTRHDGLSAAEAAEVLGTTANAVRLRAHRTSEVLKAALDADDRRGRA